MKLSESEFALLSVTLRVIYSLSVMQTYSHVWTHVVTAGVLYSIVPAIHKIFPVRGCPQIFGFRSPRIVGLNLITNRVIIRGYFKSFWEKGTKCRSGIYKQALLFYIFKLASNCTTLSNFKWIVLHFPYLAMTSRADPSSGPTALSVALGEGYSVLISLKIHLSYLLTA